MRTLLSTCLRYLGTQRMRKCTNTYNAVLTAQCHARTHTRAHSHRREHNETQAAPLAWQAGVACDAATWHHETKPAALLLIQNITGVIARAGAMNVWFLHLAMKSSVPGCIAVPKQSNPKHHPLSAIAAERSKLRLNVTPGGSVMSPPTNRKQTNLPDWWVVSTLLNNVCQ